MGNADHSALASPTMIPIEVAYAAAERQLIVALEVAEGTTLEQAILQSGLPAQFPEIDLATLKVGNFGKLSKLSAVVRAGDRVEIYRPLRADPKAVRKQRAADGKRMRKGGGDAQVEDG